MLCVYKCIRYSVLLGKKIHMIILDFENSINFYFEEEKANEKYVQYLLY